RRPPSSRGPCSVEVLDRPEHVAATDLPHEHAVFDDGQAADRVLAEQMRHRVDVRLGLDGDAVATHHFQHEASALEWFIVVSTTGYRAQTVHFGDDADEAPPPVDHGSPRDAMFEEHLDDVPKRLVWAKRHEGRRHTIPCGREWRGFERSLRRNGPRNAVADRFHGSLAPASAMDTGDRSLGPPDAVRQGKRAAPTRPGNPHSSRRHALER